MSNSPKKQTRNAERTKEKILHAAEQEFAAKGFEGTSLASILKIAGVNKRMIYHYFGDKMGLYVAVFSVQWELLSKELGEEFLQLDDHPKEALKKVLIKIFDYFQAHQNFLKLIMWEGLEGGRIPQDTWQKVRGPIYHPILSTIERAQAENLLSKNFDSTQLVISFLGDILFYFGHSRSIVADMLENDPLGDKALAVRRNHLGLMLDTFFEA